jgi:hypothetical protein
MTNLNNRIALVALLALLPVAVGCAANVGYTENLGNPGFASAEYTYPEDGFQRENLFRVAFDASGDLYPDPARQRVDGTLLAACRFSLRGCLEGYDPAPIAEDFARRLNSFCLPARAGSPRTLVILVHGINNSYPEARRSYRLAQLVIRDRFPALDAAFLEIYWDARRGDPLGFWGHARASSKWVGLGLRRVLAGLDHRIPVRALSHSRGASVITSALWDLPLFEEREEDERFATAQRSVPPPTHPGIRLGLVVPAVPETDFDDCPVPGGPERVIVAVNEDDPAVGKGLLNAGWIGSTRLGCSIEAYRYVEALLNRERAVAHLVDVSSSDVHDFKDYLLRRAVSERFLPLLLGEGAEVAAGAGGNR